MAKYKVLTPLLLDGQRVEPDEVVELEGSAAAELGACQAVEALPDTKPGKKASGAGEE